MIEKCMPLEPTELFRTEPVGFDRMGKNNKWSLTASNFANCVIESVTEQPLFEKQKNY